MGRSRPPAPPLPGRPEHPRSGPYWRTWSDLASYDFTYAQRIGWKWDAVLRELARRGWQPPSGPLLDWGCGSGIAGRRVLEFYGPTHFGVATAWTTARRSRCASRWSAAREAFPGLDIWPRGKGPPGGFVTLVVSHVLNELDDAGRARLGTLLGRAGAVLWVEPGTYADSRALIAFREEWLRGFRRGRTLHARSRLRHAPRAQRAALVPPFRRAAARPAQRRGLGALWPAHGHRPAKHPVQLPGARTPRVAVHPLPSRWPTEWSHVIGSPRLYKGYAKILNCSRVDVAETEVWQRDNPELIRAYKKGRWPDAPARTRGWQGPPGNRRSALTLTAASGRPGVPTSPAVPDNAAP